MISFLFVSFSKYDSLEEHADGVFCNAHQRIYLCCVQLPLELGKSTSVCGLRAPANHAYPGSLDVVALRTSSV